jgi:hypothetical protein
MPSTFLIDQRSEQRLCNAKAVARIIHLKLNHVARCDVWILFQTLSFLTQCSLLFFFIVPFYNKPFWDKDTVLCSRFACQYTPDPPLWVTSSDMPVLSFFRWGAHVNKPQGNLLVWKKKKEKLSRQWKPLPTLIQVKEPLWYRVQ